MSEMSSTQDIVHSLPVPDPGALPVLLRHAVRQELAAGENLLWLGQPDPRKAALSLGINVLFMLVGVVIAAGVIGFVTQVLMNARVWNNTTDDMHVLLLLPMGGMLLLALWLFSMPIRDWRRARHKAYLVTDKRVMFAYYKHGKLRVKSIAFDGLKRVMPNWPGRHKGHITFFARKVTQGAIACEIDFVDIRQPDDVTRLVMSLAPEVELDLHGGPLGGS